MEKICNFKNSKHLYVQQNFTDTDLIPKVGENRNLHNLF